MRVQLRQFAQQGLLTAEADVAGEVGMGWKLLLVEHMEQQQRRLHPLARPGGVVADGGGDGGAVDTGDDLAHSDDLLFRNLRIIHP